MNLVLDYNAGFRSGQTGAIIGNPFAGDPLRRSAWQQGYNDGRGRVVTPIMGQAGEGAAVGPARREPDASATEFFGQRA
jgi:hypothetical protein